MEQPEGSASVLFRSLPAVMTSQQTLDDSAERDDVVVSIDRLAAKQPPRQSDGSRRRSCPGSPRDRHDGPPDEARALMRDDAMASKHDVAGVSDGIDANNSAGLFSEPKVEDPDADIGNGEDGPGKGGKKLLSRRAVVALVLNTISIATIAVGGYFISTQGADSKGLYFDWLIFFGGFVPFFYISSISMKYIFYTIEVLVYREPLYHYHELRSSSRNLLFSCIMLIWSFVVLSWIFCTGQSEGTCNNSGYAQSAQTVQRILMCTSLGCLASFMAALASKLLSTHFLSNTYFKKLQKALEKENLLKILSDPKGRRATNGKRHHTTSEHSSGMKGKLSRDQSAKSLTENGSSHGQAGFPVPYVLHKVPVQNTGGHSRTSSAGDLPRMAKPQRYSYDDLTTLPKGAMKSLPESNDVSPQSSAPGSPRASLTDSVSSHNSTGEIRLQLDRELLDRLQMEMLKDEQDVSKMTDEEVAKLRTAVVIKTSASMMKQYKFSSEEEQRDQLKRVKDFGKALYYTIKGKDSYRPYITLQDVRLFFPDTHDGKKQAANAFSLFTTDPGAKVTLSQIIESVITIYKDRGNIAASLTNTDSMVGSLRVAIAVALHFLFLGFYLLIWKIDILAGFSAFSATVLALSFIFGNSIRNMFEAILFLFVVHPYDIGDWVQFKHDDEVIPYEVTQITLLHTQFRDNARQPTTMSNASLFNKQIKNFTRSDDHLELLFVEVDFGMAQLVKEELKLRVLEMTKASPSDFKQWPLWVIYVGVNKNMKANLLVIWAYTCFPGDWDRKLPLRDRGIQVVTDVLAKHGQNGARYTFNHQMAGPLTAQQMPSMDMQSFPPEVQRAVTMQQQQQAIMGHTALLNNMV